MTGRWFHPGKPLRAQRRRHDGAQAPVARVAWSAVVVAMGAAAGLAGHVAAPVALGQEGPATPTTRPIQEVTQAIDRAQPAAERRGGNGRSVDAPDTSAERQGRRATGRPGSSENDTTPENRVSRGELINAAVEAAVELCLREIEQRPITDEMTVGSLLQALGPSARPEMRRLLRSSPQIGGPRFLMPETAQVQLHVSGDAVAQRLIELVEAAGENAPLTSRELENRLGPLRGWSVTRTGTSVGPRAAMLYRPGADILPRGWAGVTEEARRNAFAAARDDAISQILKAAGPVVVTERPRGAGAEEQSTDAPVSGQGQQPATTLQIVLSNDTINAETRQWLRDRPLTRLRYAEDRRIEVKLAVEPAEFARRLRVSMSKPEAGMPNLPDEEWAAFEVRLDDHFRSEQIISIIGQATAVETLANTPPPLNLPARAPEWTRLPITASGSSTYSVNLRGPDLAKAKLQAQSEARDAAREQLRESLNALPVGDQTLGELAARSPGVAALVNAAIETASLGKSEYLNGACTTRLAVNSESLWKALEGHAARTAPSR